MDQIGGSNQPDYVLQAVDAGLLTGESRPVDVEPGMRVHAGTVNVAGVLEVLATATG